MSKLLEEGYIAVLGSRSLAKLNRDLGHGIVGKKNKYNAPENYEPGQKDDKTQGFSVGSIVVNEREEVFMCVNPATNEARWLKLGATLTKESFVPGQVPEVKPEPVAEVIEEVPEVIEQPVIEKPVAKEKPKGHTFGADAPPAPSKSSTGIPESMPWFKYLAKAGFETMEALEELSLEELSALPYMNDNRAKDVLDEVKKSSEPVAG